MKLRYLIRLLLAIACAHAANACDSMKPYLDDLNAGRTPAKPALVKDCNAPDTEAVANALAAFMTKAASAGDVEIVLEQIRSTYEENHWLDSSVELAAALEGKLPAYKRYAAEYALLDNLPDYLEETHSDLRGTSAGQGLKSPARPRKGDIPVTQDDFPWLPWIILGVAILLTPLSVIAATRFVRRAIEITRVDGAELARRLDATVSKANTALQTLEERLQTSTNSLAAKVDQVSLLKQEHLDAVSAAVASLAEDLHRFGRTIEEVATTPGSQTSDPLALEHQVLGDSWKLFYTSPVLHASFDEAAGNAAWKPLLDELAKCVPSDLQSSFDAAYAPCKEHRDFVRKLSLIPRIVEREIPRRPNDAEELRRTRELAAVLATAQSGPDGANPLNFRFKRWATDTFLPFADIYLQRAQQAGLEKRDSEIQTGAALVRQLLQLASVEPIEVQLGETTFDSTRYIGRGTSNDPRFADGVITGVVRNGFIEAGQVIRQPEVIVNRMR